MVAISEQIARRERGSDFHTKLDLTRFFDDVCAYLANIEPPRIAGIAVQKALLERSAPSNVRKCRHRFEP